ncbi:MAG TPA: VOC family protein [Casimicrobiaceae bacterium]|nr:VOC family protein [Casimicrobiaceae bacterium]
MVQPVPAGYHSVTPYLLVRDANRALAFYAQAFRAREVMRFPTPDGKVAHAEIMIGDSHVMLADETGEFAGPQTLGGAGVSLMLYVDEVDATFARAIAAGASERRAVADQFYGDRNGTLADPFGHVWTIATHVEDVSVEEPQRRMAALGSS